MTATNQSAQALQHEPTEMVTQIIATVSAAAAANDDAYALDTKTGGLTAKRAASCWLQPQPGDRVLVALGDDDNYVLAVLERGDGPVHVHIPTDAEVTLDGQLSVTAKKDMSLSSGRALSLLSGRLDVRALDAGVALERLTVVGRYLQSEIQRMRIASDTLDSVVDRISQRTRRFFRTTTEIEQVRAGQLDLRAKQCARIHGDTTMMTAKQLVKVDADQIHMG